MIRPSRAEQMRFESLDQEHGFEAMCDDLTMQGGDLSGVVVGVFFVAVVEDVRGRGGMEKSARTEVRRTRRSSPQPAAGKVRRYGVSERECQSDLLLGVAPATNAWRPVARWHDGIEMIEAGRLAASGSHPEVMRGE